MTPMAAVSLCGHRCHPGDPRLQKFSEFLYHPSTMKNVPFLVFASVLLFAAVPLSAHHGDAGRYEENVTVLTGTVVEVQLVDPHSILVFDVPNEKGQTVRWQAELGGRNALAKNFGWNKSTLKFGDKLTITGRRVKSGAPYINLTEKANVVLTDSGKEIFRTPNYEPPAPK
jgi:Family of unknown function (DUF6152)